MKRQLIDGFGWKIMDEKKDKLRRVPSVTFGLMTGQTVIGAKNTSPFLNDHDYEFFKFKHNTNIDLQEVEPAYYIQAANSRYVVLIIKDGNLMLDIGNKKIFLAEDIGLSGEDKRKIAGEMLW